MLLGIVSKPLHRDKFEVSIESVAYLTALVAVSEEVRSRCHVKHALPRWPAENTNEPTEVIHNTPAPVSFWFVILYSKAFYKNH